MAKGSLELIKPETTSYLEDFLVKVAEEMEYLDSHYTTIQDMLGDAMKGAMSWAPQCVMGKVPPDPRRLRQLAIQLLTVCYVNERNQR